MPVKTSSRLPVTLECVESYEEKVKGLWVTCGVCCHIRRPGTLFHFHLELLSVTTNTGAPQCFIRNKSQRVTNMDLLPQPLFLLSSHVHFHTVEQSVM